MKIVPPPSEFKFREASLVDWKILLYWRNDPLTRAQSFHQEEISESSHKQWLENSLENPARKIFIVDRTDKNGTQEIGMLRQDEETPSSLRLLFEELKIEQNDILVEKFLKEIHVLKELSWSVAPQFRGRGLGKQFLGRYCFENPGNYYARIKMGNIASRKMAEGAGFRAFPTSTDPVILFYSSIAPPAE